ncbi:biopolymer transporter ExbD [Stenotrophomonas sp. 24(2023)]|uniref:biopolymer transporter ExbD n=1 Tax=Stenotrophomonas sp. 24(2023) TaxID=3068324 RepID=UPI0031BB49D2
MHLPEGNDDDDTALPEQHDINVTPFIDVMLVLLIIFMVAAPLSTVDIAVQLPASRTAAATPPDPPLQLALSADGSLRLQQQVVAPGDLGRLLDARSGGDRNRSVLLAADRQVAYQQVIAVLDQLRMQGYLRVGLVAQDAAAP